MMVDTSGSEEQDETARPEASSTSRSETEEPAALHKVDSCVRLPWGFWSRHFRFSMTPKPLNLQIELDGQLVDDAPMKVIITQPRPTGSLIVSGLWGASRQYRGYTILGWELDESQLGQVVRWRLASKHHMLALRAAGGTGGGMVSNAAALAAANVMARAAQTAGGARGGGAAGAAAGTGGRGLAAARKPPRVPVADGARKPWLSELTGKRRARSPSPSRLSRESSVPLSEGGWDSDAVMAGPHRRGAAAVAAPAAAAAVGQGRGAAGDHHHQHDRQQQQQGHGSSIGFGTPLATAAAAVAAPPPQQHQPLHRRGRPQLTSPQRPPKQAKSRPQSSTATAAAAAAAAAATPVGGYAALSSREIEALLGLDGGSLGPMVPLSGRPILSLPVWLSTKVVDQLSRDEPADPRAANFISCSSCCFVCPASGRSISWSRSGGTALPGASRRQAAFRTVES